MANLEPPRIEDRKPILFVGTVERYNNQHVEGIPGQWWRFAPHVAKIPGKVGNLSYGVCFNMDDAGNFDYMCAVEVSQGVPDTPELKQLSIAEQRYAVFHHRDHISKIKETWDAIFSQGLPSSGQTIAKAPQFEAYGEEFNPQTGNGGLEIWIPIERR